MFDREDLSASFKKRQDADGKVFIMAKADGGASVNTPYMVQVNEYGYNAQALADNVYTYFVGVPEAAIASGEVGWMQIGGRHKTLTTPSLSVAVGHALTILNGAVADGGADFAGQAGAFAVCVTATTSATSQDVILVPERILATT